MTHSALNYLEAFINARNGRCLPSEADRRDAERALVRARWRAAKLKHLAAKACTSHGPKHTPHIEINPDAVEKLCQAIEEA